MGFNYSPATHNNNRTANICIGIISIIIANVYICLFAQMQDHWHFAHYYYKIIWTGEKEEGGMRGQASEGGGARENVDNSGLFFWPGQINEHCRSQPTSTFTHCFKGFFPSYPSEVSSPACLCCLLSRQRTALLNGHTCGRSGRRTESSQPPNSTLNASSSSSSSLWSFVENVVVLQLRWWSHLMNN